MDLQLQGRRALVTGSTAGIGFAIAARLAGEGVTVTLNGRTLDKVAQAVERLRALHPTAEVSDVRLARVALPAMFQPTPLTGRMRRRLPLS